MKVQKKSHSDRDAAFKEIPFSVSTQKRRFKQKAKAALSESPIRHLDQHHGGTSSSPRNPVNKLDEIRGLRVQSRAGTGSSGGVDSSQIEPQDSRNSSFFPSATNFKVIDGHFNSFRDHISTGNVIINMSQPKYNESVFVHVPTRSASDGRREDQADIEIKSLKRPTQMRKSSEIYYRHLLVLGRGSPLWIPEPSNTLPIEYQKAGIGIGDVGILKESGGFDFLFNVYQPLNDANNPINPRAMPDGFSPLDPPEERDVNSHAEFKNHSFLASSHVDSRPYKSSGIFFESGAEDGAILTMPKGANSIDLENKAMVRKYVKMNAKKWYTYANEVRGRDVPYGELRLVVGKTSATTWGMATFSRESKKPPYRTSRLTFKSTRSGKTGSPSSPNYRWEYSGKGEAKCGPDEYEIERLRKLERLNGEEGQIAYENQSLFIRTINVTLQDEHRLNNTDVPYKPFPEPHRSEVPPVQSKHRPKPLVRSLGRRRPVDIPLKDPGNGNKGEENIDEGKDHEVKSMDGIDIDDRQGEDYEDIGDGSMDDIDQGVFLEDTDDDKNKEDMGHGLVFDDYSDYVDVLDTDGEEKNEETDVPGFGDHGPGARLMSSSFTIPRVDASQSDDDEAWDLPPPNSYSFLSSNHSDSSFRPTELDFPKFDLKRTDGNNGKSFNFFSPPISVSHWSEKNESLRIGHWGGSRPSSPIPDPVIHPEFDLRSNSSRASSPWMARPVQQTVQTVSPAASPSLFDPVDAPLPSELHPSKTINEYLLNCVPEATMAITEDGDWISVLQSSDTVFPADDILLSRIKEAYNICLEEGVVFLQNRNQPDSLTTSDSSIERENLVES